jgi:hypothetical protein
MSVLVRKLRVRRQEVLSATVFVASMVKDIGVAANIPPLSGSAGIVLSILQAIQVSFYFDPTPCAI